MGGGYYAFFDAGVSISSTDSDIKLWHSGIGPGIGANISGGRSNTIPLINFRNGKFTYIDTKRLKLYSQNWAMDLLIELLGGKINSNE